MQHILKKTVKVMFSLREHGVKFTTAKVLSRVYYKISQVRLLNEAALEIPLCPEQTYQYWLLANYPRRGDLQHMKEVVEVLPQRPTFSILVPVYNTNESFLKEMIDSVLDQVYPHWELCLADDASTAAHVKPMLEAYQAQDSRIKVVFLEENGHISKASNAALEMATGEFVALLDHDDLLVEHALYEMALRLNRFPETDWLYSDEDKIDEHRRCYDPFFKPDWCPDALLSRMYTSHFTAYRRSIVEELGGFRVGFEGSQDYDLALRFSEKNDG